MEIPTEKRKAISVNPNMMIIYGLPKVGKTSICAGLENHLIAELESGGADYVDARVMEINKATHFNDLLKEIKSSDTQVCDYLVVDTITRLDEYSEIVGTYLYMNKSVGSKFNWASESDENIIIKTGKRLRHTDPEFETVHEIPNGYGYQYSRQIMNNWYSALAELVALGKVKHIILLAHVKDKFLESKTGELVTSIELNLTGKVKGIYSSKVDAIAYFVRKGDKGYLSFENKDKVICGGRCDHLQGKILISEKNGKSLKTHWDKIYI